MNKETWNYLKETGTWMSAVCCFFTGLFFKIGWFFVFSALFFAFLNLRETKNE